MKKVLVLGATSAIARATAECLAVEGCALFLAGRDSEELNRIALDLRVRYGSEVHSAELEAGEFSSHTTFMNDACVKLGGLDGVVFAIGLLGDQPDDSTDPDRARRLVDINLTSAVSLLADAAARFEAQGSGYIAAFSSVAGDRGKQSNFVYCAAKSGLSTYLQGLRQRVESKGVRVYTLKLGFVDTPMTYGMDGLFLVASPEEVAAAILKILNQPSGVYYIPRFWRLVMWVISLIPERIFKRLQM